MPIPHPQHTAPGTRRTVIDCGHPGQPHRHGTHVAYVKDRCRCPACTAANTADSRRRRRDRVYGITPADPFIDVTPAREHVAKLRLAGHGYLTIGQLAGTTQGHLRDIARTDTRANGRPPIRRVRSSLAAALLAIRLDTHPALVEATSTHRRIRALVALGYPLQVLAGRLRRRTDSLTRTLTATHVTRSTARAVSRLYTELADNPPSPTTTTIKARRYARQRGWVPPMAWDDIDSDPAPIPNSVDNSQSAPESLDKIAIERAISGSLYWHSLTDAEAVETVNQLVRRGLSARAIAQHLHASPHTIRRHLSGAA